eukprot:Em0001g2622a
MQTLGNKDSSASCSLFSNCKGDICTSPRLACLIFINNIISSLDTSFLYIAQKLVTAEVKSSSDYDWQETKQAVNVFRSLKSCAQSQYDRIDQTVKDINAKFTDFCVFISSLLQLRPLLNLFVKKAFALTWRFSAFGNFIGIWSPLATSTGSSQILIR